MQQEEILGKAYDSSLMKRLIKYLSPYKKQVILAIILSIIVSLMEAIRPYFIKIAVDENIKNHDSIGLLKTTILFFLLMIVRSIIQFYNAYLTQWIGQKTIYDLRMEIFRHLQKLSIRFFDTNPIGRLITRVTNDVEVLNEMFSSGIVMVFSDIFMIVGIIGFMVNMNWKLTLVSLSVLPILFYGTFLFRRKAREAYRDVRTQIAKINTFMQEHIGGMNIVQIFGKEKKSFDKFSEHNANHRDANIRSIFYYAVFYPVVDLIASISIGLIIWYGGLNVYDGIITIGAVMAFLQFIEMFWRPIRDLSEKYNIMQSAMASSERIFTLLDDKSFIAENKNLSTPNSFNGEIEFKNVWFSYADENYVLKNISFKIPAGKTFAFVGHTGAGKTTIINLLLRFYEIQKGEILIDGINIKNISQEVLRKYFGVVFQDLFLFSGTIQSNISLNNKNISDEMITQSVEYIGLSEFVNQLPNKYLEEVKERGATLSVGQKQLISFARALAFNPKILILDEATSSIDSQSEILIQNAIQKLLKNRTSIVIAHRLSTIQNADKILVLHKGEVREEGNHQELLKLNGIYSKLYQLQFRQQEVA